MPKPSRALILFSTGALLLLALPVVLAAYALARTVFVPPVRGTRFLSYDGALFDGACTDQRSTRGGQVLVCSASFHISSRFQIINHETGAVAWCIARLDDSHFELHPPLRIGPLIVNTDPPVPTAWGGCTEMIPIQAGRHAQIILNH